MIAGRSYPLKVKSEDESSLREVVNEINDKVKHFQLTYTNRDKQDCLAMTLLTYAVDYNKSTQDKTSDEINNRLNKLDSLLDEVLS